MKKYKDLSIKVRVPLMLGIASLAMLTLVCTLLMMPLRTNSFEDSAEIAQMTAASTGSLIAQNITGTANILHAYSCIITDLVESKNIRVEKKREVLLSQLRTLVLREDNVANLWCIIEPNALDGMDSAFINTTGSNGVGLFAPWIAGADIASADHMVTTDLYRIPKTTGNEFISEPYLDDFNGTKIIIFSMSIPITVNGKFIGIIATDYHVNKLNSLIENSSGRMITSAGTNAIHHDIERIGKPLSGLNSEILEQMSKGRRFHGFYSVEGRGEVFKVFVPIPLCKGSKPWYYVVDITKSEIYESANSTAVYMVVFFLVGVALISAAGWIVVRPILNGITDVTGIIRKLSLGQIDMKMEDTDEKDELGVMNRELGHLIEGLKRSTEFARSIGEGRLDVEFHLLSEGDVLGNSLLEMRKSLQKATEEQAVHAQEEERRGWITSGLAKFAEILRSDNSDMDVLAYNIVSNMVEYLDANQGGIFILNDAEKEADRVLELKGCYAYDRQKFIEQQVLPGEGLVGACFLEGKPIYLTDVPNNYITITSGLGNANPNSLLICPLKLDNSVLGIIELASFKPFEPYQREFVQKVSESIASTIASVRINIRTNRLLEQSKHQAEEMANAEEELRQNMEEMQATQEESRRREHELHNMQATIQNEKFELQAVMDSIDREFLRVIYDTNMTVTDINDYTVEQYGVPREQLLGSKITAKMPPEEVAVFTKNWNEILDGKIIKGEGDRITTTGVKHIWYIYTPIKDMSGKTAKVMMIGNEVK